MAPGLLAPWSGATFESEGGVKSAVPGTIALDPAFGNAGAASSGLIVTVTDRTVVMTDTTGTSVPTSTVVVCVSKSVTTVTLMVGTGNAPIAAPSDCLEVSADETKELVGALDMVALVVVVLL